jgi:hypothetical protein
MNARKPNMTAYRTRFHVNTAIASSEKVEKE